MSLVDGDSLDAATFGRPRRLNSYSVRRSAAPCHRARGIGPRIRYSVRRICVWKLLFDRWLFVRVHHRFERKCRAMSPARPPATSSHVPGSGTVTDSGGSGSKKWTGTRGACELSSSRDVGASPSSKAKSTCGNPGGPLESGGRAGNPPMPSSGGLLSLSDPLDTMLDVCVGPWELPARVADSLARILASLRGSEFLTPTVL